jgi:hypothetical protein
MLFIVPLVNECGDKDTNAQNTSFQSLFPVPSFIKV